MNSKRLAIAVAAGVFASAVGVTTQALAQEQALSIELNDAANLDGACRVTFVAVNKTGSVLDKTSYDVITFDAAGKVGQSLAFQFGKLAVGKTRVVKFDLAGQTCESISRLLVNDASECEVAGQRSDICLDALTTSTRTKIEFGL